MELDPMDVHIFGGSQGAYLGGTSQEKTRHRQRSAVAPAAEFSSGLKPVSSFFLSIL